MKADTNIRHNYDTVSEAVNHLIKRGYTTDFSLIPDKNCIVCNHTDLEVAPEEFNIDEIYRFEGITDPGDEMIVFALSSEKHKVKGVLVNAFGMYSDSQTSEITKRLQKHL